MDTHPPAVWDGQLLHLTCLSILLALATVSWIYIGKQFPIAFWFAISIPILHQTFVWLSWRLELRSAMTSTTIGFQSYLVIFFVLFIGRFISMLILAWLDRGSMNIPEMLQKTIVVTFLILGLYAVYSVKRYFGMVRAAGADHFDESYRTMPIVKEGIFRFTSNAMYMYVFLLFWAIALIYNSIAAIVVAAFSHAYIWVHYYSAEKPDMDFIYASASK